MVGQLADGHLGGGGGCAGVGEGGGGGQDEHGFRALYHAVRRPPFSFRSAAFLPYLTCLLICALPAVYRAAQTLLPQLRDAWAVTRGGEPGATANAPGNSFASELTTGENLYLLIHNTMQPVPWHFTAKASPLQVVAAQSSRSMAGQAFLVHLCCRVPAPLALLDPTYSHTQTHTHCVSCCCCSQGCRAQAHPHRLHLDFCPAGCN